MDSSSAGSVPLPPLFPNFSYPIANNLLRGTGQLTWLSPKAGLISCSKPVTATVSFQLKDFCDAGVSDLTSVLRVGFRLAFHAVAASDSNDWIANYVAPMSDSDLGGSNQPSDNKELDLESIEQNMPPGVRQAHNKDPYSLEMELHSLSFLLSIFHKNCVHFIPLSSLHSRISNSGKEELYRYIGSSSLKRRQFIERRSYIFHIAENDVVFLQPPEIYTSVCLLSGFLLCHGGVTSSDALFAFFNQCAAIPNVLKESIQKNRHNFMHFLSRHTFAFAPFPSQFYVAVRRNLPYFDYTTYIKKNFAACVYPRPGIAPAVSNFMAPGSVTRPSNLINMSTFNGFDSGPGGHGNDGNANGGAPMFGGGPTAQTPMTPMTPMTPLFQDDHMLNSQASGRFLAGGGSSNNLSSLPNGPSQSVWPSEMGYFEHHRQHAAPPQTPLFNGSNGGPVPIVGGGHHSNAAPIRGGSFSSGGSSGTVKPLLKFDLLKRPSDLSLMTNGGNGQPAMLNLPMLPKKMNNAATATMDSATQTDNRKEELNSNTERVDRSTGSNSPICQCKCNCRPNSTETNNNNSNNNNHNPAQTPTPPNPAPITRSGLASFESTGNNGFRFPAPEDSFLPSFLAHHTLGQLGGVEAKEQEAIRQRSISVQEQQFQQNQRQFQQQQQRPLFSNTIAQPANNFNGDFGLEFGQFRPASDSFFNSLGFPMPPKSATQSPASTNSAGPGQSTTTANSSPTRQSTDELGHQGWKMAVQGQQAPKSDGSTAVSGDAPTTKSSSSSNERLFDPFAKVLPFELKSSPFELNLNSLKL